MHEVSKSINEYNIWIEKFNEEKAKKDEEELKKYASLNEEELIRFDNIYKHQENKRREIHTLLASDTRLC